jgi:hypothetical protein
MRQAPTYTSWRITCNSPEEVQALQQWLPSRIDLNRVWTDTVRSTPNGIEQVQTVPHRLGDYFAGQLPKAGRFWKDLMVNILQEIESTAQKVSIELDSKGHSEPAAPGTGSI